MLKKTLISCAMIGAVALAAVASSGGGKKKSEAPLKPIYTPIRTTNGFTLKAGPSYTGSHILSSERSRNFITYSTVVTYQKGNTVYILPQQVKSAIKPTFKTNLNLLDLKIKLHK
ncbi:hypothetical protein [Paraflavitalea soli]|nr:hypothetical protein [Paraflavitalea soli]